jgi:hypothetical protein
MKVSTSILSVIFIFFGGYWFNEIISARANRIKAKKDFIAAITFGVNTGLLTVNYEAVSELIKSRHESVIQTNEIK